MREWLSWWSTTLPRSGPRVRVPSRALDNLISVRYFFWKYHTHARVAQLVEHDLAKVGAAGSSPVSRFFYAMETKFPYFPGKFILEFPGFLFIYFHFYLFCVFPVTIFPELCYNGRCSTLSELSTITRKRDYL